MSRLFTEARVALFAKAIAFGFLIAFVATLASMRDMMLSAERGFGGDFLGFYAAGTLAREGRAAQAYSADAIVAVERRILPLASYELLWAYPPVFQMIMLALAGLPYVWAYAIWAAVLLACHVVFCRAAFGESAAFWVTLGSSSVYVNVLHGQNGLLSSTLLGAGLLLLARRPLLAGLAIGALCYKPQIGIAVGLLLLAGGQWRAVSGAVLSVAALGAASAAVLGVDVWSAFIEHGSSARLVLESDGAPLDKLASVYAAMRKLGAPVGVSYVLHGIVALSVLLLAIRAWRGSGNGEMPPRIAMAAASTPLISPYFFDYDLAVSVLPIGVLLADGFRNGWIAGMRIVLPIAWLAPAIAPTLSELSFVQIMPLASIALFAMAWQRCTMKTEGNRRRRWT